MKENLFCETDCYQVLGEKLFHVGIGSLKCRMKIAHRLGRKGGRREPTNIWTQKYNKCKTLKCKRFLPVFSSS